MNSHPVPPQSVLLTGCAGFIGWKTALKLLETGNRVVGVDNLNDYYDVTLKAYRLDDLKRHENFVFYKADIESLKAMDSVFRTHDINAVINLAARAGVRYSIANPHIYMSTNAQGTLNLLELVRKYKVKKFVLASTSSLYAGQEMPFSEDLPVNTPISPYAASKKAAEVMVYTYHHLFKVDATIFRYFTGYGPAGRPDMSPFRFIRWIDEGKEVLLYGDGTQTRDFTYVDDIAEGTVKGLNPVGFEIINLGSNHPYSMNQFISIIESGLAKTARIRRADAQDADMRATWADIKKAERVLGWRPKTPLEQGIKQTISWYLQNRDWVKGIKIDPDV